MFISTVPIEHSLGDRRDREDPMAWPEARVAQWGRVPFRLKFCEHFSFGVVPKHPSADESSQIEPLGSKVRHGEVTAGGKVLQVDIKKSRSSESPRASYDAVM